MPVSRTQAGACFGDECLIPMIHNFRREEHALILNKLTEIAKAGGLRLVLDEIRFSLAETGKAYSRLSSGEGMGKVVVEI